MPLDATGHGDRLTMRAAGENARIALHIQDPEAIQEARATMRALLLSHDDRVRQKAAAWLQDHDWEVYAHEHPAATATQRVEHAFPDKITLEIVRANAAPNT